MISNYSKSLQFLARLASGVVLIFAMIPQGHAQWGFDEPEQLLYLDFRADIAILNAINEGSSGFTPLRPSCFGFHLETGHNFGGLTLFSGVGMSYFPFKQRQSQPIEMIPRERISSATNFISIEVPVGINVELGKSFSVHAALKMHFMNPTATEHSFGDLGLPDDISFSVSERNEVPNWQFIPELAFGLDYDIGSRMRFVVFGGFSMRNVKGASWDYTMSQTGEDDRFFAFDMEYQWWRYGAGLTYHIIR